MNPRALLSLALRSLWHRRTSALLTVLTLGLSVGLVLSVHRLGRDARSSFASTVSGTDLLVGARSGPISLLLYAVFHVGDATNNVSWKSYQDVATSPEVAWTVPISLGDSHRGFRVVGTTTGFFDHLRFGDQQAMHFASGHAFGDVYDAVLGARVARALGYGVGTSLVLTHGTGVMATQQHADKPFVVTGILAPTGTPFDDSVFVGLDGIEAIHVDWQSGMRLPGQSVSADEARRADLTPKTITAFFVGLHSRLSAFSFQRAINDYPDEALLAVLPGVALQQLWSIVGVAEQAIRAIGYLVVAIGLCGLVTTLLSMLNERRREMAVLRAVGASPATVFALMVAEALLVGLGSCVLGLALLYAALAIAGPWLAQTAGLRLTLAPPDAAEWALLGLVMASAFIAGCVPALVAYRRTLADGLQGRL